MDRNDVPIIVILRDIVTRGGGAGFSHRIQEKAFSVGKNAWRKQNQLQKANIFSHRNHKKIFSVGKKSRRKQFQL
ncbi:MAG: hypothetical protein IKQ23_02540 [Treponema sp.]|nr:hypothetical protein [Treponema sp.]